jgi:SAM-dependent methyltransferase
MAIGSIHIEWLSRLASRGAIPANADVLDLGPQDIWSERDPLRLVAARHLPRDVCNAVIDDMFGEQTAPRRDAQAKFYSIFGASRYRSLDLGDPRAEYSFDLNYPLPGGVGKFDIVTNFGTTEHVFNIGQSFANIHGLLKEGGLQLHTLATYGFIDHGFYNVHPCVFLDMAKANSYEVVDFVYCDNINVRMTRPIEEQVFDFSTLPIQLDDVHDTCALMTKAALLFHHNLQSEETRRALEKIAGKPPADPGRSWFGSRRRPKLRPMPDADLPIFLVFDFILVALRRTARSPEEFVMPLQSIYAEGNGRTPAATTAEELPQAPNIQIAASAPLPAAVAAGAG